MVELDGFYTINRYIFTFGWFNHKRGKNTATGDQNAESWRRGKRHGDGVAGLGGDFAYQEALKIISRSLWQRCTRSTR